ncbi:MAG: hypothetical protein K6E61_06760 [Bacteroidales bacterium]|nr:hypothetical protein [Bacteroidales bacterium]
MANINLSDFILKQVTSSASKVDIPSNLKDQVLGGLSDSIFGSLTQTATKKGGIDEIKELLTGKANPVNSSITALAGNLFTKNIVSKLNLGSLGTSLTALIPGIMGKLGGILKDQDGDGDVDLNDILITLKGGNKSTSAGSGLLGAATSILGGLLKKK